MFILATPVIIDTTAAFGTVGLQLCLAALVFLGVQAARIGTDLLGYRGEGLGAQVTDDAGATGDADLMALAEGVRERIGVVDRNLRLV